MTTSIHTKAIYRLDRKFALCICMTNHIPQLLLYYIDIESTEPSVMNTRAHNLLLAFLQHKVTSHLGLACFVQICTTLYTFQSSQRQYHSTGCARWVALLHKHDRHYNNGH